MTKTITKKEAWSIVLNVLEGATFERKSEVIAKIQTELELLDKKATRSNSKVNEDMQKLMNEFLKEFENQTKPVTVTELVQNSNSELVHNISSTQKASAVIKKLKDNGLVLDKKDKKRTVFYLPSLVIEDESDIA